MRFCFGSAAMNPSLECELTRVQMKRYLGGEELPEPLMEELEQHVHACASCRHYLDTQKLKLAAKLSGAKAEKVKSPVEPKGPKDSDVFHEPKQKLFTPKTLGLAAALALVLFAMSAVAKDPTIVFGRKASSALAAADKEQPSEDHSDEGAESDEADPHEEEAPKKVGEIMTGESVKKELEEKKAKEAEAAAGHGDSHSEDGHTAPETHSSSPAKADSHDSTGHASADSHSAPATAKHDESHATKPEPKKPEPKKPDMALVVAENGKTKKEPAPKPRPTAKASAPRKTGTKSKRPIQTRKSSPQASKAKPSRARTSSGKSSGSGSIKIYDSKGNPIN